ncbi:MAG: biliverdin-producing heme oxygenase [Neomegalonema sp.]|nr:biliverdin-producing heme oxygenase [Neomegalonema sp.]
MNQAREYLQRSTRGMHERVDQLASRMDLAERAEYIVFLRASCEALGLIEARLEQSGVQALLPDWAQRRRSDAIRQDLAQLNAKAAPLDARSTQPYSTDEAWGALYVLEGSRMGARLLCGRAKSSKAPDVIANMRYLTHGDGQPLWREFLLALEQAANNRLDLPLASQGALSAFETFENALRAHLRDGLKQS